MKKIIVTALALLVVGTSAWANVTYTCGSLRNSSGYVLSNGTDYTNVLVTPNNRVYVKVVTRVDPRGPMNADWRLLPKGTFHVTYTSYGSGNPTVLVGRFFRGIWRTGAKIVVNTQDGQYTAYCW